MSKTSAMGPAFRAVYLGPLVAASLWQVASAQDAQTKASPWGNLTVASPSKPSDAPSTDAAPADPAVLVKHLRLNDDHSVPAETEASAQNADASPAPQAAAPKPEASGSLFPGIDQAQAAEAKSPMAAGQAPAPEAAEASAPQPTSAPATKPDVPPGPPTPPATQVASIEPPAAALKPHADGAGQAALVDINTASATALNSIPGGSHLGHAIMAHRPYRSIKDLTARRILRESDFARIRGHIKA